MAGEGERCPGVASGRDLGTGALELRLQRGKGLVAEVRDGNPSRGGRSRRTQKQERDAQVRTRDGQRGAPFGC